ncbi:hypothetical protein [Parafilimonas sp.]|uniref:hypothetical protein n=1 Tax=Parafilimonas sp. TaxID=1969739 RepID=UPI003F7D6A3C
MEQFKNRLPGIGRYCIKLHRHQQSGYCKNDCFRNYWYGGELFGVGITGPVGRPKAIALYQRGCFQETEQPHFNIPLLAQV